MLNTIKNVHQNLLIVIQSYYVHNEFVVELETLSTIRSCSKAYNCNMYGIQQYSSDTVTLAVVSGIQLVDIVE